MISEGELPRPPAIEAISRLSDLEALAHKFRQSRGYFPELISHWDPKLELSARIEAILSDRPPHISSLVDYVYSGYLQIDARIRDRLKERDDRGLLLTPSGTTSIANVLGYLRNTSCNHLHIIAPAYFAVEALAATFEIEVSFSEVVRANNGYVLPEPTMLPVKSAVWLTLPVYGTSCYIEPSHVAHYIDSLPEQVVLVLDEGLAFLDKELLSQVRTMSRVIRISTPHKSICVNGEKVSIITFPEHLTDGLDAWSECFAGGIGAGGSRALQHLGSDNYDLAVREVRSIISERTTRLKAILDRTSVSLDRDPDGHFITAYWPSIPMALADDRSFMRSVVDQSGCVPMPSSRNRHPNCYGFAFRVNLLRLDEAGLGGLARLADVLDRHA